MSNQPKQNSQLEHLRRRVSRLRAAQELLTEYQSEAPAAIRAPLGQFASWLRKKEAQAIDFGKSLKRQEERNV